MSSKIINNYGRSHFRHVNENKKRESGRPRDRLDAAFPNEAGDFENSQTRGPDRGILEKRQEGEKKSGGGFALSQRRLALYQ